MARSSTTFRKGISGNPNGRPNRPEVGELRNALDKYKKENNVSFLEDFVMKAKTDRDYAIALFKKIAPNNLDISVNPAGVVNIVDFSSLGLKKDKPDDKTQQ
jgi:hypothetical protein